MHILIGPILARGGGYAFDAWSPEEGLTRGYTYCRVDDAHYARNVEIRSRRRARPDRMLVCSTADEFISAVAEREATFRTLVANLGTMPVGSTVPLERHPAAIAIVNER